MKRKGEVPWGPPRAGKSHHGERSPCLCDGTQRFLAPGYAIGNVFPVSLPPLCSHPFLLSPPTSLLPSPQHALFLFLYLANCFTRWNWLFLIGIKPNCPHYSKLKCQTGNIWNSNSPQDRGKGGQYIDTYNIDRYNDNRKCQTLTWSSNGPPLTYKRKYYSKSVPAWGWWESYPIRYELLVWFGCPIRRSLWSMRDKNDVTPGLLCSAQAL